MKKIVLILMFLIPFSASANTIENCIWSYEGFISYDLAEKGCNNHTLRALTEQEQESLFELTPQQTRELQAYFEEIVNQGE